MFPRIRHLVAAVLLVALCAAGTPAFAQITIDETDVRRLVDVTITQQQFSAQSPSDLSAIFNASGANQTYDFRPYAYDVSSGGINTRTDISGSTPSTPFAADFKSAGANVLSTIDFAGGANPDSTAWLYEKVTATEASVVGSAFVTQDDADNDGDSPDTLRITYDPPRLDVALPATYQDTWSRTSTFSVEGGAEGVIAEETYASEVVGYGTLITPAGSVAVLQVQTDYTQTVSMSGQTIQTASTTTMDYLSEDGRLSASITRNNITNGFPNASWTTISDTGLTEPIAAGASGASATGFGASVTLTTPSSTAGTVSLFRFEEPPFNLNLNGSATSDDGSTITPNRVWLGAYFVVTERELSGWVAQVCLDTQNLPGIGNVPGIGDLQKLVLLTRADASADWTPLTTTVDGTSICASGLTGFSQFAIGGNDATNPLPVNLASFTARADGRAAVIEWTTASETNNDGFYVERRTGETWRDVQFVKGAGTTTQPQRYRLRVGELSAGTHAFRLRQVDVDGTPTLSGTETVLIAPDGPLELAPVSPHPVRSSTASVRLTLREAHDVRVDLYDLLGRRVQTVHDGPLSSTTEHTFTLQTRDLPSGLYVLRATGGGTQVSRKMMVVR